MGRKIQNAEHNSGNENSLPDWLIMVKVKDQLLREQIDKENEIRLQACLKELHGLLKTIGEFCHQSTPDPLKYALVTLFRTLSKHMKDTEDDHIPKAVTDTSVQAKEVFLGTQCDEELEQLAPENIECSAVSILKGEDGCMPDISYIDAVTVSDLTNSSADMDNDDCLISDDEEIEAEIKYLDLVTLGELTEDKVNGYNEDRLEEIMNEVAEDIQQHRSNIEATLAGTLNMLQLYRKSDPDSGFASDNNHRSRLNATPSNSSCCNKCSSARFLSSSPGVSACPFKSLNWSIDDHNEENQDLQDVCRLDVSNALEQLSHSMPDISPILQSVKQGSPRNRSLKRASSLWNLRNKRSETSHYCKQPAVTSTKRLRQSLVSCDCCSNGKNLTKPEAKSPRGPAELLAYALGQIRKVRQQFSTDKSASLS